MTNPVDFWHAEHMRFATLLDFFEEQVRAFHDGNDPDYELMRDVIHYLHHYADRYHHPREDVAFQRITAREPGLRFMINRLLQEHRVMNAVGETLLNHLNDILEDVVVARATVESAAATYIVYYRHHLQTEETKILPEAVKLLQPEDWAAVAAAVPAVPDPLFGDDVLERYRELRKRVRQVAAASN